MEEKIKGFTPDYIDTLLTNQIFVFGSNALGYHTGGASGRTAAPSGGIYSGQLLLQMVHDHHADGVCRAGFVRTQYSQCIY